MLGEMHKSAASEYDGSKFTGTNCDKNWCSLTGTSIDATPAPRPEMNLPAYSMPSFVPSPIRSQPAPNRMVEIMSVNFRPRVSIIQPPRGPPNMAPMFNSDWKSREDNTVSRNIIRKTHWSRYVTTTDWCCEIGPELGGDYQRIVSSWPNKWIASHQRACQTLPLYCASLPGQLNSLNTIS